MTQRFSVRLQKDGRLGIEQPSVNNIVQSMLDDGRLFHMSKAWRVRGLDGEIHVPNDTVIEIVNGIAVGPTARNYLRIVPKKVEVHASGAAIERCDTDEDAHLFSVEECRIDNGKWRVLCDCASREEALDVMGLIYKNAI